MVDAAAERGVGREQVVELTAVWTEESRAPREVHASSTALPSPLPLFLADLATVMNVFDGTHQGLRFTSGMYSTKASFLGARQTGE